MSLAREIFAPPQRLSWLPSVRQELARYPGRAAMTLRLVVGVVVVTIISMTLQTPLTSFSAYMVFFVTKENRVITTNTGIALAVGATVAVALSLFLYRYTFDYPELRLPAMAATVFGGMFLSRVLALGPLAFSIGFVLALTQSMAESAPNADMLVRGLLWLWVIIVFPVAITVVVNQTLLPAEPRGTSTSHSPGTKKGVFVPDAFTNSNHVRFGLKVALAAMSCYVIYMTLDWPGIRTAFITCCFIALESTEATLRKARLRLVGCAIGGLLGFLSIMYVVPRMQSIVSLAILTAVGTALAGWVAAGSQRIAYAGLQIALAFFMCIFQGFAPATDFDTIRDRLVGIVLGIVVTSVVFHYLWPEREAHGLAR
jgi:multidrug resistance protein MdtO